MVELRSVNHRFLEIRTRAPREIMAAEPLLDKLVRARLSRGHCSANISFESADGPPSRLDRTALESHLDDLSAVASSRGLELEDLTPALAQAPDLFSLSHSMDAKALEAALTTAADEAIDKLLEMREAEGAAMAGDMDDKLAAIRETLDGIAELAAEFPGAALEKARQRIGELISGNGLDIDPSRIEAEAALLADRADINEEITRLASHCEQMGVQMKASGPVGRRLEFLVQEMGRETNTIGSKSAISGITHMVVEIKAQLEKIRELAQNIE